MVMKRDSGAVAKFTGGNRSPETWQHLGDPRSGAVEPHTGPFYGPKIVPCPRERLHLSITLDAVRKAFSWCVWHLLSCRACTADSPVRSAHALPTAERNRVMADLGLAWPPRRKQASATLS